MSFTESVRTCFQKYADFSGRAGRAEFWWFFLFVTLVSIGATIFDAILGLDFDAGAFGDTGVLQILTFLALFLPDLAVNVRRLHDTGRSGWWVLIVLVPCLGLIMMLVFCVTRGEAHANKYGERLDWGPGR
ncbi:MAG TPA: DUF805 domain-containing protein [Acidimicrobiales bacterium]